MVPNLPEKYSIKTLSSRLEVLTSPPFPCNFDGNIVEIDLGTGGSLSRAVGGRTGAGAGAGVGALGFQGKSAPSLSFVTLERPSVEMTSPVGEITTRKGVPFTLEIGEVQGRAGRRKNRGKG